MENVLKLKLELLKRIALSDHWFNGNTIFISARNSKGGNLYFINNPKFSDKADTREFIDIDVNGSEFFFGESNIDVPLFLIHFLIYNSNEDHQCIIFINDINVIEVSRSQQGLIPISQESIIVEGSEIGIFDFSQFSEEFIRIANSRNEESLFNFLLKYQAYFNAIRMTRKKLFLKNLGCLLIGKSVEEVWFEGLQLQYACQTQMRFGVGEFDLSTLIRPSERSRQQVKDVIGDAEGEVIFMNNPFSRSYGEMEFAAMVRQLEATGVPIGYDYRFRSIFPNHAQ